MQKLLYLLIILFVSLPIIAQNPITIKVISSKNLPVPYATLQIIGSDSVSMQSKTADSSGTAVFVLRTGQPVQVHITALGFTETNKGIMIKNGQSSYTFILDPGAKTLKDVVISSRKPLMKQEDDKVIVDPEPIAATTTNAFEIMEKTPGLFVDQDGNVYISSTTPATIYINGRELKMSNADIASLLKSLPPNSIDKMEIMRTPSAKYDAGNSGGVVNIILKKGVKLGLTGSVSAGIQQGVYGTQFVGFNLTNNNEGNSSYINMQYTSKNNFEEIITNRHFATDSLLSQDAYSTYPTWNIYTGYGISRDLNKKWSIHYDGRLNYNSFLSQTTNNSQIKKISNSSLASDNRVNVGNNGHSNNINQEISLEYKIDSSGSNWTAGISYNYNSTKSIQSFTTGFIQPVLPSSNGEGDLWNGRHYIVGQTDLKKKFKKEITLETGLKSGWVDFSNHANYFNFTGGTWLKSDRTNHFQYNENIQAFYFQLSKKIGATILKIGSRLENTNMNGRQLIPIDTSFSIHRADLFPYVYLSRKVMKIAGYELRGYLVYRRSISRPGYDMLNPMPKFVDAYLTETGNPALKPQFTQNIEANISVDDIPLFAIGQNDTRDIFTNVIYQPGASQSVAYRTYDNLGHNKEFYLRGLGALPPGGKYFFVIGAQYNHNYYNGFYENKTLLYKRGSWVIFTRHDLKLGDLSRFSIHGFVRFNGQQQFYELSTFGMLNLSLSRQFMNKKLTVTTSMNDVFYTNKTVFVLKQGSVDAWGNRFGDTRRWGLNLRYNFGIRKKEENNNPLNTESPERGN